MLAEPTTHDLSHSSEPTGSPPTFQPVATHSDAAVFAAVSDAKRAMAANAEIWRQDPQLDDEDPAQIAWQEPASALNAAYIDAIRTLTNTPIVSLSVLAAAAEVFPGLIGFHKGTAPIDEELAFVTKIMADGTRLGTQGQPAIPLFQPVATAPTKTADEALGILAQECNELADREEAMHTARGVFDTNSAAYAAAGKAIDPITDHLQFKWTTAALVWPDTYIGLAAKARIYHSMRHALVGCIVPEAQPLLESITNDIARLSGERPRELRVKDEAQLLGAGLPVQGGDSDLLSLGRHFEAQWRQERIVVARNGSDAAIKIEEDRTEDLAIRIRDLPATTPAGWHVKARTIAWAYQDGFGEARVRLVEGLLRDLGAIEGGVLSAPALPDPDRYLLAYQAPFYAAWAIERAAAAVLDGSDGKASEAHEQAADAVAAVTRQIESFPATSLEGLKLKAAALSSLYPDEDITSEAITGVPGKSPTDIRLIVQIIRDLRAMVSEPGQAQVQQAPACQADIEQAA